MNAADLANAVAPPRSAVATVVVRLGEPDDIVRPSTHAQLFELGSITKTLVGTLLATFVVEGAVDLDSPAGLIGDITWRELATHTSGLPRLAPNAMRPPFWPRDPYRHFSTTRLAAATQLSFDLTTRGSFNYSNFGFDVLAAALGHVGGAPVASLIQTRIFEPAGMNTARCQPCPDDGLVRGVGGHWVIGGRRWHTQMVGAGGIDLTIDDFAVWLRANLVPPAGALGDAIRLAHDVHHDGERRIGLAWIHRATGSLWHNGGTGAFSSVAEVWPSKAAIGALVAHGPGPLFDLDARVDRYVGGRTNTA